MLTFDTFAFVLLKEKQKNLFCDHCCPGLTKNKQEDILHVLPHIIFQTEMKPVHYYQSHPSIFMIIQLTYRYLWLYDWHIDPCHLIGGTHITWHSLLLPFTRGLRKSHSAMGKGIYYSTVRIILVSTAFKQSILINFEQQSVLDLGWIFIYVIFQFISK